MSEFARTPKQTEIMTMIVEAAARGQVITKKEIYSRLSYRCTEQALGCSLKFLKKHDMITVRNRGFRGLEISPTVTGMSTFKPKEI